MDKITVSMTSFMEKIAPEVGFTRSKVLEMARAEWKDGRDFMFIVKATLYTIPLISLEEYFNPKPEPVAAPAPQEASSSAPAEPELTFPKVKATKAAGKF